MIKISSWGRLSSDPHIAVPVAGVDKIPAVLGQTKPGIAYGMGRSYGDACLNAGGNLWQTAALNHLLEFDPGTGMLRCEAGVLLRDIQQVMIPQGWSLPVTPGTQIVTVGGAIANDVHGKNQHLYGCFGDHVQSLKLFRTNGDVIDCGPDFNADWFAATVGGVGLTGVIGEAVLQLRRVPGPWLTTETIPFRNLEEFFEISNQSEKTWEHSVSWIDCITDGGGRGLFMRGNPSDQTDKKPPVQKPKTFPFVPPFSMVNPLTLRPFNMAYFNMGKLKPKKAITHYQSFFYPLDNLLEWNRLYGPRGFFQYQSVVPFQDGREAIDRMLKEIARAGAGSFLGVLKTFGERKPKGLLSFAQSGITLALDFPNHGVVTEKLFERLDQIVLESKGRGYLAKDARMPRSMFEAGYPRLGEFLKYRDPGISSELSRRLMGS